MSVTSSSINQVFVYYIFLLFHFLFYPGKKNVISFLWKQSKKIANYNLNFLY